MKYKLSETITMAHGSGGQAMAELIDSMFIRHFNPLSADSDVLEDQARISIEDLAELGDRLAFTTDSFVVEPLFFPGGDIGKLAVTGTVNDLLVGGATPLYLTCSLIIEEGLPLSTLEEVIISMAKTAQQAGVYIVTGDTKVVNRGACDKLFINTAGIGVIKSQIDVNAARAVVSDAIIINGYIGDHGAAIVDARGELCLESSISSDCQPLTSLVESMLAQCPDIHCMRDATRGGVATVLNEFSQASRVHLEINETNLPIREQVKGMCEILGLDPLYLANEGKLVAIVPHDQAQNLLSQMKTHPDGKHSAIIGYVTSNENQGVSLKTKFGTSRKIDVLVGEQLPRIC